MPPLYIPGERAPLMRMRSLRIVAAPAPIAGPAERINMDHFWNTPTTNDLTWEGVSADGRAATDRAAVRGGWVYRATAYSLYADPIAVSLCFVPDAGLAPLPDAGDRS